MISQTRFFRIAAFHLALTVALGAFGAHGLEKYASALALKTFQTGVTYHQLHALALLVLACSPFQHHKVFWPINLGIFLFSGGCYAYALTGIKFFALIVPVGGVSFIVSWLLLALAPLVRK
jgi:uncharacterized membrane protein YgdD (TMEM256/DUF423 family)